ncbi:flippase-like domain-containing protein, partial [Candidatus Binatia bacterium]|nr:flippase-like domain-containing protein [Candidatus Binatia bacterium]
PDPHVERAPDPHVDAVDVSKRHVDAAEEPAAAPSKRSRTRPLLLLLGFATLGVLLYEVNTQDLLARFLALGWRAPLLLWPYGLIAIIDGWAYSFTLPRNGVRRPPLLSLIMIRLAGESVNTLTPTAYLGGEPVKAMLLVKRGITTASSTVSVVVAKTALTVGQIVFVLLGIMLTLERFDIVHDGDVLFIALCAGGAIFVALLVRWQQRGLFVKLSRVGERFGLRGARFQRFASVAPEIDRELGGYYRTRGTDFAITTGLHFLGWLLGTVEVKVFADLLQYPISWRDAFIIEAISQPLSLGSALIPGALGVREAGGVAIFGMLGLDESAGLALWLLRRVREAVYNGVGLLYLMYATRRRAVAA